MDITSERHVVGHDVKHPDHLREDKDSMSIGFELGEELVEQNHLAATHDDVSEHLRIGVGFDFGTFKEERVIPVVIDRTKTSV